MYSMTAEKERKIVQAVVREESRLRNFIRSRVGDLGDAEDILQDVFFAFVEAFRVESIEQIGAWLFRVARNRIIDRFRKRGADVSFDDESLALDELLPSPAGGPEAEYARGVLV